MSVFLKNETKNFDSVKIRNIKFSIVLLMGLDPRAW